MFLTCREWRLPHIVENVASPLYESYYSIFLKLFAVANMLYCQFVSMCVCGHSAVKVFGVNTCEEVRIEATRALKSRSRANLYSRGSSKNFLQLGIGKEVIVFWVSIKCGGLSSQVEHTNKRQFKDNLYNLIMLLFLFILYMLMMRVLDSK